jgi:LuxR family maltose regulon positive regulatory protein
MTLVARQPSGTKRAVARLPPAWVSRPRLTELLDRGPDVTVVVAPAGAGKTALVAEWLGSRVPPAQGAWLTLDARDNEPGRLGLLLTGALGCGSRNEDLLRRPDADTHAIDRVFDEVARRGVPHIMVLDDVHELTARTALAALDHLLLRAPGELRLVLTTRADPAVSLARLRMEGRLCEIRAADLAFTHEEAAALFSRHDLRLAKEHSTVLWQRTEGWAAGLRLAALALQGEVDAARFVADAARTEAVVADYLLREVLERQPRSMQQFLLRTSVAERLNVELATVLSGDRHAERRLLRLEHDGVFLSALDEARAWFRYHALFGALLRARLRQEDPALTAELFGRAAHWYAEHGLTDAAETHARLAHDWQFVGLLACRRWVRRTIACSPEAPYVEDVPSEALTTAPTLALLGVADAIAAGNRALADERRGGLDGFSRTQQAASGLRAPVVARALLDLLYGRAFGSDVSARAAFAHLCAIDVDAGRNGRALRAVAMLRGAELGLDDGDFTRALMLFFDALGCATEANAPWIADECRAALAFVAALRARLRAADRFLANVEDREHPPDSAVVAYMTLARAVTEALRGRPVSAGLAAASVPSGVLAGVRPVRVAHATILFALGGSSAPTGADTVSLRHPIARELLAVLGSPAATDDASGYEDEAVVRLARRHCSDGRGAEARELVNRFRAEGSARSRLRTKIDAFLVGAVAASAIGDVGSVVADLRTALALAAPGELRLPFLQCAAEIGPLLETNAAQLDEQRSYALELLGSLQPEAMPVYLEPLTDRERAVLGYLPTMMSNAEIAHELFVSVNTVKTHLKAVYRKLGVERRRDAVVRARQLEIL